MIYLHILIKLYLVFLQHFLSALNVLHQFLEVLTKSLKIKFWADITVLLGQLLSITF